MRLTTKGRYAVTAMLDLALHQGEGPVSLADIARRQEISLSYLEQLFARLRRNNLVKSVRGPGGGYLLQRADTRIFVAEIIDAVDESYDSAPCEDGAARRQPETCVTDSLWGELSRQIHHFLGGISLAELVERGEVQAVSRRQQQREQQIRGGGDIAVRSLS
jgi:Rrf2 family iron-sulfur cluster assembly transcriptional regulator